MKSLRSAIGFAAHFDTHGIRMPLMDNLRMYWLSPWSQTHVFKLGSQMRVTEYDRTERQFIKFSITFTLFCLYMLYQDIHYVTASILFQFPLISNYGFSVMYSILLVQLAIWLQRQALSFTSNLSFSQNSDFCLLFYHL